MTRSFTLVLLISAVFVNACSTGTRRTFLDSSFHEDRPPEWVKSIKTTWESEGKIILKTTHGIGGDQRVNGCFDLSKLDAAETILLEISNDIRGSIDHAEQSISEQGEILLGKVRSSEYQGKITGLRETEHYYERYQIADLERIDCHVLFQMSQQDYNKVKRSILDKLIEVDPRLREAIAKKQIDFFEQKSEKSDAKSSIRMKAAN